MYKSIEQLYNYNIKETFLYNGVKINLYLEYTQFYLEYHQLCVITNSYSSVPHCSSIAWLS